MKTKIETMPNQLFAFLVFIMLVVGGISTVAFGPMAVGSDIEATPNTKSVTLTLSGEEPQLIHAIPTLAPKPVEDELVSPQEHFMETLVSTLVFEEGFRETPYIGSQGYLHIGYGTKLSTKKGLNPSDFPLKITEDIALQMLADELVRIEAAILNSDRSNTYARLDEPRQVVIMSMAYQIGISGLMNFNNMWDALEASQYDVAGMEALDSKWAAQTPNRAFRHAATLANGTL